MLAHAVKTGLTPDDFWNSSLQDVVAYMDGYLYRHRLAATEGITQAWLAAVWTRSKRVPPLRQILRRLDASAQPAPPPAQVKTMEQDMADLAKEMAPDLKIIGP